ncbi:uncharacterized protein K02A2.6-like [Acipenser ruthenus]|uniref:uncharacterized protein K02A2.6-like n=1 Tax=Acipenser ruthenus TaxID=7906 RepID=UPI00274245CB|nr:uncharacterized protein K02A2.6-like [Acipenser ruthenus]
MARGDCNAMPKGSGIYSGGEGLRCRNDSCAALGLQAVLVEAMPSQGRMKQQESWYEYRLIKELETLRGPPAKIYVDKEATPMFFKAGPVPYAMKPKVEAELDRLLRDKIIEPVKFSKWAALFAKLSEGAKFSKMDMSHAYQQVILDEESKKYVTINTHKGLFTVNRLPFGVSSSPAIFQRIMEGLLQGISHVAIYLDDILVTGKNDQEHLQTLSKVLQRVEEEGLRLKRSKCTFLGGEAEFLGNKVDATGPHPLKNKVQAIQNAPAPTNITELKAYLGLLNYYNRCSTFTPHAGWVGETYRFYVKNTHIS